MLLPARFLCTITTVIVVIVVTVSYVLAWIVGVFPTTQLLAQVPPYGIRFESLSIEQGLSQSSVHCIQQDRHGFLWFGTQDGLNRYDGYTFTVYRHAARDTTTLSDGWITQLHEDRTGHLWVATRNGVNLFDAATERFTRFRVPLVRAMCSDSAGNVIIGTVQGAFFYSYKTATFRKCTTTNGESNQFVYSLTTCSTGETLLGTANGLWRLQGTKLVRIGDKRENRLNRVIRAVAEVRTTVQNASHTAVLRTAVVLTDSAAFQIDLSANRIVSSLPLPMPTPTLIKQGSYSVISCGDGSVWLHTPLSVGRWNPARVDGQGISPTRWYMTESRTNQSRSVPEFLSVAVKANDNALWIGTNFGAWRIDAVSGTLTRFRADRAEIGSLSDDIIQSLYQDRMGTLWLGTQVGGVNSWNPRRYKFALYAHNPFNTNSISDGSVRAFFRDHFGALWVGTDKGLNRFDTARREWTRFFARPTEKTALSYDRIYSLLEDAHGTLWIAARGGGINAYANSNRFPPGTDFKQYMHDPRDSTSLSNDQAWHLCLSKYGSTAGKIWVSTQGGGLNLLDPLRGTFTRFRAVLGDPRSLPTDSIRSATEDSKGRLWVGTSGYGLALFNMNNGVERVFTHNPNDSTSLANNTVTSVFEDSAGEIWVTTASGLSHWLPETNTFRTFSTKDGFPNDFIYGIREDGQRNLWFCTNNGLCCFNPTTHLVRTFDVHDGLQSNEFNTGAFFKDTDGILFFGGVKGFNSFLPQQVLRYRAAELPVVLITFKVNDKPRAFTQPLAELREITLEHDENQISFEFVALDFTGSSKIRYRYQLEGFDADWNYAGTRRYAAYTNLDPGQYRFRVRAEAGTAGTNNEGTSIVITIRSPFWMTWWFRGLAVLALAAGIWLAVRLRIQGIQRRNALLEQQVQVRTQQVTAANEEIQRQMVQLNDQNSALEKANIQLEYVNHEKNEFLGIAAHDLKNPLTGIMLSTNMIRNYRDRMTDDDRTDSLNKIYLSAERMFAIIRNLLDINAIDSGKFNFTLTAVDADAAASAIVDDYQSRAQTKQIQLHYECEVEHDHESTETTPAHDPKIVRADGNALTEILENLVSNAVKYSPRGKNVYVRVRGSSNGSRTTESTTESNGNLNLNGTSASASFVRIEVQDEGPGLSEEDQKYLFGRFVKLSARPTAGENSTGLGLSIVKKMVEAMDGRVWCETELGKGATFIVALPAETP
jgi:signal transduction histidine kinase/ligand-binding sensor domain-containing protein